MRTPVFYKIRVKGHIGDSWSSWFEGLTIRHEESGETLLSGPLVDEAALHGVLGKIHGLGLPLLLVAQTECPCTKKNCPRRGQCDECAAYHGAKGGLPYCFRERTKWDRRCAALTEPR